MAAAYAARRNCRWDRTASAAARGVDEGRAVRHDRGRAQPAVAGVVTRGRRPRPEPAIKCAVAAPPAAPPRPTRLVPSTPPAVLSPYSRVAARAVPEEKKGRPQERLRPVLPAWPSPAPPPCSTTSSTTARAPSSALRALAEHAPARLFQRHLARRWLPAHARASRSEPSWSRQHPAGPPAEGPAGRRAERAPQAAATGRVRVAAPTARCINHIPVRAAMAE